MWLKSVGPGSAPRAARCRPRSARWVPDRVLVPLAVDPERRLILLPGRRPDPARRRRSTVVEAWESMLRSYARLQLDLVPRAAEMLALGVPDHRPDRLPDLVGDLLADDDALLIGREGGLAPDGPRAGRRRPRRGTPSCAPGWPTAASRRPCSTTTCTTRNVFVSGNRHRFFDWGDASVSHPFLSLLVTLRVAGQASACPTGTRCCSGCATPTSTCGATTGARQQLREQCDLALRVGPLQRALTWRRILRGVHPDERAEWADSVPGWTAEHLEPGTLTAAPAAADVGETARMAANDDASGDLAVTGSLVVPAAALNWRFSRSSGPGGQGVNTADSRVELSVAPLDLPGLTDSQRQRLAARLGSRLVDGVLTIAASEHRQQLRNRQAARERLAAVLRAALAPPPPSRRRTKPTRGSQERRIEAKKQRGQLKKQRRSWD